MILILRIHTHHQSTSSLRSYVNRGRILHAEWQNQTPLARSRRRNTNPTALVVDAASRPLSARISGDSVKGAGFCGDVPDTGRCSGTDVAAGASLSHGWGDPVLRHPHTSTRARTKANLSGEKRANP